MFKKNKIIKYITRFLFIIFLLFFSIITTLYLINKKYITNAQNNEYITLKTISSSNFELKDVTPSNHIYVSLENISPYLIDGYILIEDKNFYKHKGIDVKAILRATIKLIENKGKITQGGSTITQQVVKNNILSQERTFERKIKEMFIAIDFEQSFSKKEILEIYLNTNYYGNGCYGVEKASLFYFGKSAKKLSISESATLIGISNSPNNYNPIANYDLCIKKRNKILEIMINEKLITKEEYEIAINEDIKMVLVNN